MIDAISGLITFASNRPLNPENIMATQFLLSVRASDAGVPPRFAIHTLYLLPVPALVLHNLMGKVSIQEESALGTIVAQFSCEAPIES